MTARSTRTIPRRGVSRLVMSMMIGAAALVLAACSTDLHPGNAAVVNGTSISQTHVDNVTDAFCAYTVDLRKQNPSFQSLGIADLRSSLVTSLVQFQITREVAADLGLTVRDSQVHAIASQFTIPDTLNDADTDILTAYFNEFAEASILQAVIGAHQKDKSVTNADGLSQNDIAGQKPYMKEIFQAADVSVNPSYGSWNGASIDQGTGSLSVLGNTPTQSVPPGQATPSGSQTLSSAEKCG